MLNNLKWKSEEAIKCIPVNENGQISKLLISNAYSQWKLCQEAGMVHDYLNQVQVGHRDGTIAVSMIFDPKIIGNTGGIPFTVPGFVPIDEKFLPSVPLAQQNENKSVSGKPDGISLFNIPDTELGNPYAYTLVPLPLNKENVARSLASENCSASEPVYCEPQAIDPKKCIIVGVIDDAINAVHERFCDNHGNSRVDYLWIQDAVAIDKRPENLGQEVLNFVPYGREWNKQQIDGIKECFRGNESAIWKELEIVTDGVQYRQTTLNLRRSHGTHVADLAAGNDPAHQEAVNTRIIGVQLPVSATQDTSGVSLIAVIRDAAAYIYKRAERISRKLKYPIPVFLNISYGIGGGARDGQHILERSLQAMAINYQERVSRFCEIPEDDRHEPPAVNVLPAGNGHLSRGHARSLDCSPDKLDLRLQLQPQDQTSSYVELWFPKNTREICLKVESPCGLLKEIRFDHLIAGSPDNALGRCAHTLGIGDEPERLILCRVTIDEPSESVQNFVAPKYWRVLIALAPTTTHLSGLLTAPNGEWRISATKSGSSGPISAWISRDESLDGFAQLGRQAYFSDEFYEENLFDVIGDIAISEIDSNRSVIARDSTLSGIASGKDGKNLVVVAANYWDNLHLAPYSASSNANESNPILTTAPADTSRALPGLLAAGSRTGSVVPQNGTSVAVPQMVRWLARNVSAMEKQDREQFDAENFIRSKLGPSAPKRPIPASSEMITKPEIREQRLLGGFIDELSDKESGSPRFVRPKYFGA